MADRKLTMTPCSRRVRQAITTAACVAVGATLAVARDPVTPDQPERPPPQVHAYFVAFEPHDQPCGNVPLFDVTVKSEVVDMIGDPELQASKGAVEEVLAEERRLGVEVDEAQGEMLIATANHLRALSADPWNTPKHLWTQAQAAQWSLRWYLALYAQFEVAEERRDFARDYYTRLGKVFSSLDSGQQEQILDELDVQMECLQGERRNALAVIEHHRRQYADRLRRLKAARDEAAGSGESNDSTDGVSEAEAGRLRTPDDVALAAKAALGEADAKRAYLWLVPETALTVEATDRALRGREAYLTNTRLHDETLAAFRADPGLRSHIPTPNTAASEATRLEIMQVRARRALLHLYLREQQLEAGFKRSASWLQTSTTALESALRDAQRLQAELNLDANREVSWSEWPATRLRAHAAGLAAFAIAFRLSGDLLGTLVIQPVVDGLKDEVIKPIVNPYLEVYLGDRVKSSIEKAYDDYWKAREPLELRQRALRNLATQNTTARARAFIAWARDGSSPASAGSIFEMAERTVTALLEDGEFVASTGGGLPAIFAPLCNDPADLAAIYVTGASYEQRGNAKAAASRISVARGLAALPETADLGHEAVERIVNPVTNPLAVDLEHAFDPEASFYANWAYMAAAIPWAFTVDRVWNLPTRVQLGIAYNLTELPHSQDAYLQSLVKLQGVFVSLHQALHAHGFDYDDLDRRSPQGWRLHNRLLATSHEYSEAYRRVRAAHWEREKSWIWARHESDATRGRDDVPPQLSETGRYVMADTVAHEELELSELAATSGGLKARYLALTGDFEGAAAQYRELGPLVTHHRELHRLEPYAVDYSEQVAALEAQAVRDQAVEVYAGLYRTAVTQTVVSIASTGLSQSIASSLQNNPWIKLEATEAATGWNVVREQIWRTLNPWAGKLSVTGVVETVKEASIEAVRTSASQIIAGQQSFVSESDLDQALDLLFSVTQDTVEDLGPRLRSADRDNQADPDLYAARLQAAKDAGEELARAEADGDVDRANRARAALIQLTGDDHGVAGADPLLDEARRHAIRIADELAAERLRHRMAGRTPTDPADVGGITDDVRKAQVIGARSRLHAEGISEADIGRLLDPSDPLQLSSRLFTDGFDVHTLRHALTRAVVNDPAQRHELLVDSMVLDRHRTRVAESLLQRFLDTHPGWKGTVGVLREGNRVAVIGGDPSRAGSLDQPGLHVDLEYDLVVRDDAPGDARTLRQELESFIESEGYGRPGREGQRNNLGLRLHYQTEAELRDRGRRSGRRAPEAELSRRTRLPDRDPDPDRTLDPELARRMEREQGFKADDAQRMQRLADRIGGVAVVRNGNADSVRYMDDPNYFPKPKDSKAKTAKAGPDVGLVVDPTHNVQARHWDDAIDAAEQAGNRDRAERLRRSRKLAVETWNTYGAEMLSRYGYMVTETGRVTKPGFEGIHGDYDLHGVYVPEDGGTPTSVDPTKRLTRVSLGDGTGDGSPEVARRRRELLAQANQILGTEKGMFLHGGQDDWDHPGKTADPPVTVFFSKELENRWGRTSPVFLADAEAMRDFYENTMGVGWEYSDGHGDLAPAQGIFKNALYRSVGGNRWSSNQDGLGTTTPDGLPQPPGWITIPRWQAYGLALDLSPRLAFLIDPQYGRAAVAELPNTHERAARLAQALRQTGAFFDLVDAWIISQPDGNRRYNADRREWLAGRASRAVAAVAEPAPVSDRERELLVAGADDLVTDLPEARGTPLARTLLDVGGIMATTEAPPIFTDVDLTHLSLLAGIAELGARLDPFSAPGIGGRTPASVDFAVTLLEWMREMTARMYADVGLAFAREYERMLTDGTEVEETYGPAEAGRIAQQLEAARGSFPGLTRAFMRPPFELSGARMTPVDASTLRGSIRTDVEGAMRSPLSNVTTTVAPELDRWVADWRAIAE